MLQFLYAMFFVIRVGPPPHVTRNDVLRYAFSHLLSSWNKSNPPYWLVIAILWITRRDLKGRRRVIRVYILLFQLTEWLMLWAPNKIKMFLVLLIHGLKHKRLLDVSGFRLASNPNIIFQCLQTVLGILLESAWWRPVDDFGWNAKSAGDRSELISNHREDTPDLEWQGNAVAEKRIGREISPYSDTLLTVVLYNGAIENYNDRSIQPSVSAMPVFPIRCRKCDFAGKSNRLHHACPRVSVTNWWFSRDAGLPRARLSYSRLLFIFYTCYQELNSCCHVCE